MTRAKVQALNLDDLDLALEPFHLRGRRGPGIETLFFISLAALMLIFAVLI